MLLPLTVLLVSFTRPAVDPATVGVSTRRAVAAYRAVDQRHRRRRREALAGVQYADPAAGGAVTRSAVAADRAVDQRHVRGAIPPPKASGPAVLLPLTVLLISVSVAEDPAAARIGRVATNDGKVFEGHLGGRAHKTPKRRWLEQQHTALLVRVDRDAGPAVNGDVRAGRELAAGEDDGLPLHLGREHDRVGGRAVASARASDSRRLRTPSKGSTASLVVVTV